MESPCPCTLNVITYYILLKVKTLWKVENLCGTCPIKECREIITEQGFKIDVSENKGLVTLNVSWLFPSDSEVELVL